MVVNVIGALFKKCPFFNSEYSHIASFDKLEPYLPSIEIGINLKNSMEHSFKDLLG